MAEPSRRVGPVLAALVAVAVVVLAVVGAAPSGAVGAGSPAGPAALAQQAEPADPQIPVNPGADPERARRSADDILSGGEYQEPEAPDRSWLDRVRRWIGDRLPDLGGEGAEAGSQVFSFVVLAVVAVGAVATITYVLIGTRGRRRVDEEVDAEVDVTPIRTTGEWEAEAERCEAAGDHRGAVRARFRALTTALARRGLVADTPGRTAGEMRADVAVRAPALVAPFGAAADLFEEVWYGNRPATADAARTARDLGARALDAAPRRRTDERDRNGDPHGDEDGPG